MMNDHITSETLVDYIHGELTPEEDATVLAHLAACSVCAASYEEEARLSDYLRAGARAEERELPPALTARIRSEIERQARPAWWQQLTLVLRPTIGFPVAAVLVLAVVLGFSEIRTHVNVPRIAATYYLEDHAALANSSLPFSETAVVPSTLDQSGSGAEAARAAVISANVLARE